VDGSVHTLDKLWPSGLKY